ncbi:hypothetical protein FO519_003010 [Halicephalobus sp. NKZ332]|nr:hypothetical protein FO519_003010 [Halicephalobus sp. NKZ332]
MPPAPRGVVSKSAQNVIFQAYRSSWISPTSSNSRHIHGGPSLIKTPKDPTSKHSVTSIAVPPVASEEVERCFNKLDLSFTNTKEAFKSKTNYELLRALIVLKLCSFEFLVKNNDKVLQFLRKALGKSLFDRLLKATFFGHFVAGETKQEAAKRVQRIRRFGVKSILYHSVESDISHQETEENPFEGITKPGTHVFPGEKGCDKNMDIFCESIDAVVEALGSEGIAAIKLTALGRPQLLLKLSESIMQTRNFFKVLTGAPKETLFMNKISEEDFLRRFKELGIKVDNKQVREWFKTIDNDRDGFLDFHEWGDSVDKNEELAPMFKVINAHADKSRLPIETLSKSEELEFAKVMQRLLHVADYAVEKNVKMIIDAEQTYFQPAISRMAVELMRKYNKNGGQILNTYQAYLKSTFNTIETDMSLARKENFTFGAKLVRGAYMDQERKRANALGYEDPINPNFEATTQMYYKCLRRIIEERGARGPGQVSVMVASHNEEGIKFAVQLMKDNNVPPSERTVCFGQLFGMCDQISFSLGQSGYSIYKCVPYGPVEDVLPYLSRRALENGGMLTKVQKERALLWSEIKRRISSGQLIYKVPQVA